MSVSSTHSHDQAESPRSTAIWRVIVALAPTPPAAAVVPLRDEVIVGRDPDRASLVIDDPSTSRAHLAITPDGDAVAVRDLGSRHGTFVEGRRVDSVRLEGDAVIRIGSTVLLLVRAEVAAGVRLRSSDEDLDGTSLAMDRVRGDVALVAEHGMPVLVLGEPGVGKDRVARAIHRLGRRTGPFIAVNCASLATGLADSELFGHTAGAFTGATVKREGLFVAATGGTLFLDEVAELPLEVQAKLLRVLESGEVRPVGSTTSSTVDVRVLAATHADLRVRVTEGRFRGDLYSRISTWVMTVPPLRSRREDILWFVRDALGPRARGGVTAGAMEALLVHRWPYNIRELLGVIAAARIRASGSPLGLSHLPPELAALVEAAPAAPAPPPLSLQLDRDAIPDADTLRRVLAECDGNISEVARLFGRSRRQIYRWCDEAGLSVRRTTDDD